MRRSLSFVLLLAACGDNKLAPDAGSRVDAPPPDAYEEMPLAIAVAGDFGSPGVGVVAKLDVKKLTMQQNVAAGAAQGDPVVRHIGDELFIINRFGSNNVTILDAKTLTLKEQLSTGENSNPQDVAVHGNKLYLPAAGTAGVVVLTRGSNATSTIDLADLDTQGADDGKPDCVSAYVVGDRLFVACGMLDSFTATENGKVAVIDTSNDMLVTTVTMPYRNPYGFFVQSPQASVYAGDLLIATVPSFSNYATGCIVRISTGASPTAACGLTNQELAGYVNHADVAPDGTMLWLAVGTLDASFQNPTGKLKGYDLEEGSLWPGAVSMDMQLIVDVAACPGGQVVATDQTFNKSGLRVFENAAERTFEPIGIGMAPTTNGLVCYDAGR